MIPREPTYAMILAAQKAVSGYPRTSAIEAIWKAMWDAASVDTLPEGQDAKRGLAGTESGAVPKADAQPLSPRES
jgi:hypothetical protein